MFPVTITINNKIDLDLVIKALSSHKHPVAPLEEAKAAPKDEKPTAPKAPPAAEASTKSTQASPTTQPAAAQGASEGNESAGSAQTSTPAASTASSEVSTPACDFETVKKAFLALSTKENGRAKCEGVLKPHGLAKLSEAKAEQYAALLAAIKQASE